MDTTLLCLTQLKPSVPFMGVVALETTSLGHKNNQIDNLDYSTHDRVKTKVTTL